MGETDVRALVDGIVEAWNARDLERLLSYLAPGVVWHDPAMLDEPVVGHDAVRVFSERVLGAFPDFSYRIREPICVSESGTRCVVPWEIRATHAGRFEPYGFAPTGQVIAIQGVDVLELESGKVTQIETVFNAMSALEQVLRLKPLSQSRLARTVAVGLQRWRASWLRLTAKGGK
jgi:steroid delta-isomerase-like uncharacterized protein